MHTQSVPVGLGFIGFRVQDLGFSRVSKGRVAGPSVSRLLSDHTPGPHCWGFVCTKGCGGTVKGLSNKRAWARFNPKPSKPKPAG